MANVTRLTWTAYAGWLAAELAVCLVLLLYVPHFYQSYVDAGRALPGITQFALTSADVLRGWFLFLVPFSLGVAVGAAFLIRRLGHKPWLGWVFLVLAVAGVAHAALIAVAMHLPGVQSP